MSSTFATTRNIALSAIMTVLVLSFVAPAIADDSWHGPGWYALSNFGGEPGPDDPLFIVKGPFDSESACNSYVADLKRRRGAGAICQYLQQDLPPD